jgi:hypothetical protein
VNTENLVNAAWPTKSGGSPTATLSATTLAFGDETVGVKSAAQTSTLTNTGNATLTISSIATSGNTLSFSETNNCGSTLAAGATCTFSITFDPNGALPKSMTVTIQDSAGTQTITSTGTGVN